MRLLAAALPLLSLFVTETVFAQEGARPRVEDESTKPIAVTVNPAALLIGRYGGNVEVVVARHHAIVASGYAQAYTLTLVRNMIPPEARDHLRDAPLTAGGEIGYRLYSGSRGADGLFVGPSFLLTPLVYPAIANHDTIELVPYHVPGVAVDVGAQAVTSIGLTIGGGIGVEYLAYQLPNDPHRVPIGVEPHWLPRVLLQAGWSF
jgi:hypothetical protein